MALDDDIRKLARISFFRAMENDALRLIAFGAETKILRAGDVLFRRGDKSNAGFIVLNGAIALDEKGDGSPPSQVVRADALLGEVAMLVETEWPATAMAREPSTVLKISRDLFHRVLREYPQSAQHVRAAVADELRSFLRELGELSVGRVE